MWAMTMMGVTRRGFLRGVGALAAGALAPWAWLLSPPAPKIWTCRAVSLGDRAGGYDFRFRPYDDSGWLEAQIMAAKPGEKVTVFRPCGGTYLLSSPIRVNRPTAIDFNGAVVVTAG